MRTAADGVFIKGGLLERIKPQRRFSNNLDILLVHADWKTWTYTNLNFWLENQLEIYASCREKYKNTRIAGICGHENKLFEGFKLAYDFISEMEL